MSDMGGGEALPWLCQWCCQYVVVGERRRLRRIGDPVVATSPEGVRIRTRIQLTEAEAAALTAIGAFLGSVYRSELARRVRCGVLDSKDHASWRAQRKQAITAVASSRWAGAITRSVEDQFQRAMRSLASHVVDLRQAINVLERRCAVSPGELAPVANHHEGASDRRRYRGYRSSTERFAKTRRLAVLRDRLTAAEEALAAGRPSMVVGGKRLWRNRNNLDQSDMTKEQWRERWDAESE